jgi:alanine-glyoxylate transaminase/serine-glyoxylate transaminase/serine-pyruvate transaminase
VHKVLDDLKYLFKTKEGQCFVFPGAFHSRDRVRMLHSWCHTLGAAVLHRAHSPIDLVFLLTPLACVCAATGTGAWEAGLTNTLSPGDKVVCFRYGQFSHLWIDQAQRLGLDVTVLEEPWGSGANEERLRQVLAADKGKTIKAVMVVHNETTTGVTSDIGGVRAAMDAVQHPALLLVDGVSSIGSCDFRMDDWRVDVAMTGSQKALSLPTGLGLVCVSKKALEASKKATLPRVFFSLADMQRMNAQGTFPYTPSVPLLYGLDESLAMLREEGLDNALARHQNLADATRAAVKAWNLQLLCSQPRWNSNSLTVVKAPPGVDTTAMVRRAYNYYNLSLGLGLSELAGKVFRIGHIGSSDAVTQLGGLAGTEMVLRDMGYTGFSPGAGVGAAVELLRSRAQRIPTRTTD